MSITAIMLGQQAPQLPIGIETKYAMDNSAPKPEPAPDIQLQGASHGERQREKIMAIIDDWVSVDIATVMDEMDLSIQCVRNHLSILEKQGLVNRHAPKHAGAGMVIRFTRAKP